MLALKSGVGGEIYFALVRRETAKSHDKRCGHREGENLGPLEPSTTIEVKGINFTASQR